MSKKSFALLSMNTQMEFLLDDTTKMMPIGYVVCWGAFVVIIICFLKQDLFLLVLVPFFYSNLGQFLRFLCIWPSVLDDIAFECIDANVQPIEIHLIEIHL